MCERCYRRALRRERGIGGIEPKDSAVYKLRIRMPGGATQPEYYSDPVKARARAKKERERGALLYFARYTKDTEFETD